MTCIRRLMANRPLAFLQKKLDNKEIENIKERFNNGYLTNSFKVGHNKWNTFYLQKIIESNYSDHTLLVGNFRCNLNNVLHHNNNIDSFNFIPAYYTKYLLTNEFEQYELDYTNLSNYTLISENFNSKNKYNFILPKEIHLVRKFGLTW